MNKHGKLNHKKLAKAIDAMHAAKAKFKDDILHMLNDIYRGDWKCDADDQWMDFYVYFSKSGINYHLTFVIEYQDLCLDSAEFVLSQGEEIVFESDLEEFNSEWKNFMLNNFA